MPAAHLDKLVKECLDTDTRMRKVQCLSRKPIPEQPHAVPEVGKAYAALAAGKGLPERCMLRDLDLDARCEMCGGCGWGEAVFDKALIFLSSAVVHTQFERRPCVARDGCEGALVVDGQEYGVLRRTAKLAFGYDLLYSFDLSMGIRCPSFWGHFREALERDVQLALRYGPEQAEAMKRGYMTKAACLPGILPGLHLPHGHRLHQQLQLPACALW
jgi:hypothetical protein